MKKLENSCLNETYLVFKSNLSFLLITIFCSLAISCSSSKKISRNDVVGQYYHSVLDAWSSINLKDDSTFVYEWIAGLMAGETKGDWKLTKKKILLNSEYQTPYLLLKKEVKKHDKLVVEILDSDNNPFPFVDCALKNDTNNLIVKQTNFEGIAEFPVINADSIIISDIYYGTIRYNITNPKIYFYSFVMQEPHYRIFTNYELTYKKGRLYNNPPSKKSKLDKKPYYEKVE